MSVFLLTCCRVTLSRIVCGWKGRSIYTGLFTAAWPGQASKQATRATLELPSSSKFHFSTFQIIWTIPFTTLIDSIFPPSARPAPWFNGKGSFGSYRRDPRVLWAKKIDSVGTGYRERAIGHPRFILFSCLETDLSYHESWGRKKSNCFYGRDRHCIQGGCTAVRKPVMQGE